ncbi:MAG: IPT/TIG domain-containing protein, partial [Rhodothermia bacterium]|nr:IPT/TIG domain-containing protein [Rhodothermia bacterium]
MSRGAWMILALAVIVTVAACDTGPAESLWDPDATVGDPPVISAVEPPDVALAGVDIVTISGSNFATDPARVIVFFGGTRVTVMDASENQLTVRAPNEPSPEVVLRVAVIGNDAESFSNSWQLALLPAEEEFGGILDSENPFAIAADAEGNIYVSVFRAGRSEGIRRIALDESESEFSATTFQWNGLDFGADGLLYGARGVRAIFQFPGGGGIQQTWAVEGN